jgi:hypothetical protein
MLRQFEDHVEALARQCFETPILQDSFTVVGGLEGGGTSSCRVKINRSGLSAWAKPARIAADNLSCVVNEKIASDLAFRLGLPVAPVQIIQNCSVPGFPQNVAVSYAASPQARHWGQVFVPGQHAQLLAPRLGAILVFHAWIDDHDHNWHDGNALLEVLGPDKIRAVFIDYSFSLTRQWKPPALAPDRGTYWSQRVGPYAGLNVDTAKATLGAIQQLDVSEIEDIIKRVPTDCLSEAEAAALALGLHQRGADLTRLVGL